MKPFYTENTTRNDTTRHDTTRHDTTHRIASHRIASRRIELQPSIGSARLRYIQSLAEHRFAISPTGNGVQSPKQMEASSSRIFPQSVCSLVDPEGYA
jgi:hypothetical protein